MPERTRRLAQRIDTPQQLLDYFQQAEAEISKLAESDSLISRLERSKLIMEGAARVQQSVSQMNLRIGLMIVGTAVLVVAILLASFVLARL